MYDTNTAEIIGAFCYHTPVSVFALASATTAFQLIIGDTICKNPVGLLEKDIENKMEKLCLLNRFKLIEPDGRTKLNLVTGDRR